MSTKIATKPSTSVRRNPASNLWNELEEWVASAVPAFGEGLMPGRMMPSLDVSETDLAVEARMDVPGIEAEKLDIEITGGNVLTVRGERKEEHEEKGRTFHRIERRSGSFARSVSLPCAVKEDEAVAEYRDGVLTITMPKAEEAKAKKVSVKT